MLEKSARDEKISSVTILESKNALDTPWIARDKNWKFTPMTQKIARDKFSKKGRDIYKCPWQ